MEDFCRLVLHNPNSLWRRFRETRFPPAALLGAFASFLAAAFGPGRQCRAAPHAAPQAVKSDSSRQQSVKASNQERLPLSYYRDFIIGGKRSSLPFQRSLLGIAVGPGDFIFALGDGEVRIFGADGAPAGRWKAPAQAVCLAASRDRRVILGTPGRVEICDHIGNRMGGFAVGEAGRKASITAVKAFGGEIFVADAAARHIRRYDGKGKQIGAVGTQYKTGGFMLPNRLLDMDIDTRGIIIATDPGRHRVTSWGLDGRLLAHFGKFGQVNREDFVGCCNPVNLAFTREGNVISAEKVAARVKVYSPEGRLLALIGPEHFDPGCTFFPVASDSRGRILAADPQSLEIKVFSPERNQGGLRNI